MGPAIEILRPVNGLWTTATSNATVLQFVRPLMSQSLDRLDLTANCEARRGCKSGSTRQWAEFEGSRSAGHRATRHAIRIGNRLWSARGQGLVAWPRDAFQLGTIVRSVGVKGSPLGLAGGGTGTPKSLFCPDQ